MRKRYDEPLETHGVALHPKLWEYIRERAREAGRPRNWVVEQVLNLHFGFDPLSQESEVHSQLSRDAGRAEDMVEIL